MIVEVTCNMENVCGDQATTTVNGSRSRRKRFSCESCGKQFASSSICYRHIRNVHKADVKLNGTLKCPLCDFMGRDQVQIVDHFTTAHKPVADTFDTKTYLFTSKSDFEHWKMKTEKDNTAYFSKSNATKKTSDGNLVSYYKCHRSGKVRLKVDAANRKRRLKKSGSLKSGQACPAYMKVSIKRKTGFYVVKYQSVHVGHPLEHGCLPMSAEEKQFVIDELRQGGTVPEVLNRILAVCGDNPRLSILTRKDLYNLCRRAGIVMNVVPRPNGCPAPKDVQEAEVDDVQHDLAGQGCDEFSEVVHAEVIDAEIIELPSETSDVDKELKQEAKRQEVLQSLHTLLSFTRIATYDELCAIEKYLSMANSEVHTIQTTVLKDVDCLKGNSASVYSTVPILEIRDPIQNWV